MNIHQPIPFYVPGLAGLDDAAPAKGTDWGALLTAVGTAGVNIAQQRQLQKINIQRARAGLKPLDPEDFAATIKVQGGADKSTRLMLWGLGGLALLLAGYVVFSKRKATR